MSTRSPTADRIRFPVLATPRALSLAIRAFTLAYNVVLRTGVRERTEPRRADESSPVDDGAYPLY